MNGANGLDKEAAIIRGFTQEVGRIRQTAGQFDLPSVIEVCNDVTRALFDMRRDLSEENIDSALTAIRAFDRLNLNTLKASHIRKVQAQAQGLLLDIQAWAYDRVTIEPFVDFDFIWSDDIALNLEQSELVDGLLGTSAMSVVYGESGSGKTFWTLDLACQVAAGMPWRDAQVTQGMVIYIAAESPRSVERRVWAWRKYHGIAPLPLVVLRSPVNLCDPNGVVLGLIDQLDIIADAHGGIVLIVVDTLSRAIAGADENAAKDMTAFVGNCDKLRNATDAHVCIVHHTGKDTAKGARGHSSLRAAIDTEIEVSNGAARVTKQRDLETMGAYGFKLVPVELGQDARGRTVATCVVEPCGAPSNGADKSRKMGANEQTVYDALTKMLRDPACTVSEGPLPQVGTRYVTREQWRVAAARKLHHDEPKYKNRAFDRALTTLIGNRHVHHIDGRCWVGLG